MKKKATGKKKGKIYNSQNQWGIRRNKKFMLHQIKITKIIEVMTTTPLTKNPPTKPKPKEAIPKIYSSTSNPTSSSTSKNTTPEPSTTPSSRTSKI